MTELRGAAVVHVGQVRQVNQDHVLARDDLYVVADGMGGHRGGEVASEVAVDVVGERFGERSTAALLTAVEKANAEIVRRARGDPDLRGMGTTLSALALVEREGGDAVAVVNVGDSRAYLLRAESADLEQISEDHSLVATLERQGQLSAEEAATHPQRNIVTRALGIDDAVLIDSWELLPVEGDRFLLCSDGLSNEVDEPRIAAVLRRIADPREAAAELVRLANEHGGRDNISVVVVDVVDADAKAAPPDGSPRIVGRVQGEHRAPPPAPAPTGRARPEDPAIRERPGPDLAGLAELASGPDLRRGPRSRFTWRVALFAVAFVALLGGTFAVLAWIAGNTYYIGLGEGDDTEVVIYQGRPGGLLWFDPTAVEHTGIDAEELPVAQRRDVEAGHEEPTFEAAERYVENLRSRIERREEQASRSAEAQESADEESDDESGGDNGGDAPTDEGT